MRSGRPRDSLKQLRQQHFTEGGFRSYIAEKLPDPHDHTSVVRPGAPSDDFREALLCKRAFACIAGSDGKEPLILVTAVS